MAYLIAETAVYDITDDAALVERVLAHDLAAFDQLVTRYQNNMVKFAASMMSSPDEAEAIAQEVFVKVFRFLPGFRGATGFRTWLYKTATNVCLDHLRRRKRYPPFLSSFGEPRAHQEHAHQERDHQEHDQPELIRQMRYGLAQLSPEHRATLVMKDLHGLSYEEIAQATGCSIGTVKSRLFSARSDLAHRVPSPTREAPWTRAAHEITPPGQGAP